MGRLGLCRRLLPFVGLFSGCSYLRGVAKDAGEVVHLGVGISTVPGLRAAVLAPYVSLDAGYLSGGKYVGTDYGYTNGWNEYAGGVLVAGVVERSEFGNDLDNSTVSNPPTPNAYLSRGEFFFPIQFRDLRLHSKSQVNISKVEAEVHVLFVGVSVGVDLAEFADFLTGIFGWDLLSDDDFVPRHIGDETPTNGPAPKEDA